MTNNHIVSGFEVCDSRYMTRNLLWARRIAQMIELAIRI